MMWRLKTVSCLEAASRPIFTVLALVLVSKVDVLVLASVLEFSVLVLVLSQDRDQDIDLQGETQHCTLYR